MASLVVYYSRTGENYFGGSIKSIEVGNTARVAAFVAEAVGADVFEIKTVKDYPADYYACCDVAKEEKNAGARPEIVDTNAPETLDAYDTIYVGYPSWWGTCPMCVFTFLDCYDLSGKTIAPFCTNEGSGLGASVSDLQRLYPAASITQGLSITGSQAANSQAKAAAWATGIA